MALGKSGKQVLEQFQPQSMCIDVLHEAAWMVSGLAGRSSRLRRFKVTPIHIPSKGTPSEPKRHVSADLYALLLRAAWGAVDEAVRWVHSGEVPIHATGKLRYAKAWIIDAVRTPRDV